MRLIIIAFAMKENTKWSKYPLSQMLGIRYPIILAPMFLVSDVNMVKAACKSGITAAIPALNYRTEAELEKAIEELKNDCEGPFGINLIVNKSNFRYKEQLEICCKLGVDYIITSLGSPELTIKKAHEKGIKVFCDVVNLEYAKKVERLGADAVIAVNSEAGGHAGTISAFELIGQLKDTLDIPVISAGGVGDSNGLRNVMENGAAGASIGTIFIASEEAPVSQEYKQAIVDYKKEDIVFTTKLSGTPCTVINTPYVQKMGTKQTALERILNKNKRLKKWMKALTFIKGMKKLKDAAFSVTYKTVWCAGPSVEFVQSIEPISKIVSNLVKDHES